jgi:hypothetical protein
MRGGKREGAGRPSGSGSKKPVRNIKKQIRWTDEEWQEVERLAAVAKMTPSELIRVRTLSP